MGERGERGEWGMEEWGRGEGAMQRRKPEKRMGDNQEKMACVI